MELIHLPALAHLVSSLFPTAFVRPLLRPTSAAGFPVAQLLPVLQILRGGPTTDGALLATSLSLIGLLTPVPPGDSDSSPEVTHCSSVPCRLQAPWCGGCMRTPSPLYCRLDLAPPLADQFICGVAPSITARYFSACPSDSASRRTPCPPE